jgi:hypothetical protein
MDSSDSINPIDWSKTNIENLFCNFRNQFMQTVSDYYLYLPEVEIEKLKRYVDNNYDEQEDSYDDYIVEFVHKFMGSVNETIEYYYSSLPIDKKIAFNANIETNCDKLFNIINGILYHMKCTHKIITYVSIKSEFKNKFMNSNPINL